MTIIHLIQAATLGAVQGVTEFLPVSSTAHLYLTERAFNLDQSVYGLSFDMFTNLGTLVATFLFFRADIAGLLRRLRLPSKERPLDAAERLPWTILLATVPVALAGFLLQNKIETVFRSLYVIATSLVLVGVLMIAIERIGRHTRKAEPSDGQVYAISLSQVLAFFPGVSRSGITISTAMGLGFDRVTAARYSFLLSLPITTLAVLDQLAKFAKDALASGLSADVAAFYLVGGLVSLAIGYLTIAFLLDFYRRYPLSWFGYYRIALGLALGGIIAVWHL